MDFWDATKVMFRRWYMTLPLLLLTAAATVYAGVAVKPDYVLTSYIQLIPSLSTDKDENSKAPRNPWNQLGLETLGQAASYAVLDQTFLDQLAADNYSINYSVVVGTPTAGATIEVVGVTREQAIQTTGMIIKRYGESVQDLQGKYGVVTQDMITMQRLDEGQNMKRPGGKVKRAILAVAGAGLLMSAGTTIAVDALLRRRRRRQAEVDGLVEARAAYPVASDGGRTTPERGSESEPVRIKVGEYTSVSASPESNGEQAAARGEIPPMAAAPLPSDATIVLPIPYGQRSETAPRRR